MKTLAVVSLLVVVLAAGCGGGGAGDLAVTKTSLQPGEFTLVVRNGSDEAARVAQVIVNDAFVDFSASARTIPPGDVEAFVVPYHWISGESYEIRLMTSTGSTVDSEIDDAA
jgi:zinc transporter, ZIP family